MQFAASLGLLLGVLHGLWSVDLHASRAGSAPAGFGMSVYSDEAGFR